MVAEFENPPVFVMMIGLPGSGKSTKSKELWPDYTRCSSDDYIDAVARRLGKSYSDVFKDEIANAQKACVMQQHRAFYDEENVVLDQTNLTSKTRIKKLDMVPHFYHKIACVVTCSDVNELERRLINREGKVIPKPIIEAMMKTYEYPLPDEGFDEIIEIETGPVDTPPEGTTKEDQDVGC